MRYAKPTVVAFAPSRIATNVVAATRIGAEMIATIPRMGRGSGTEVNGTNIA